MFSSGSRGSRGSGGPAPAASLRVTVLYFAALRDLAGIGEEQVDVPTSGTGAQLSVGALLLALSERHAALQGRLASVRVAVNEEFTETSALLHGGEVVALIPPVSGG